MDEIKKILMIDDNPNPTADMLSMYGYEVETMPDGKAGLNELKEGYSKSDLVLLEVMMTVMDGWSTLKTRRGGKM